MTTWWEQHPGFRKLVADIWTPTLAAFLAFLAAFQFPADADLLTGAGWTLTLKALIAVVLIPTLNVALNAARRSAADNTGAVVDELAVDWEAVSQLKILVATAVEAGVLDKTLQDLVRDALVGFLTPTGTTTKEFGE